MAFRAVSYWRSMARNAGASRSLTSATTPKMKPMAPTAAAADYVEHHHGGANSRDLKAEFMPIYVMLGMIVVSLTMGAHTAKQQLMHSPGVRVSKKKREIVPEVDEPDRVMGESHRFVKKSFLRKVAHLQDFDSVRSGISDPTRADPFDHSPTVESLKSVGVNPKSY